MDPARLEIVLQEASETAGSPYFLQVNCTDTKGIRSLELFPGGAAIWNRRSQITLPPSAQSLLLTTLVEQGFPALEESYGGQQQPGKSAAPVKIACRIHIEIQQMEKSTVQLAGGEQSATLLNLAAGLLDQAEEFVDSAVTPVSLQDALDKLHDGILSPKVFRLRFLELPVKGGEEPGTILRLAGGDLSIQAYSPGKLMAEPIVKTLGDSQIMRLITVMRSEELSSLPVNLWSDVTLELEVEVMKHKKVLLARRFSRLEDVTDERAQQRFEKLMLAIRELAL